MGCVGIGRRGRCFGECCDRCLDSAPVFVPNAKSAKGAKAAKSRDKVEGPALAFANLSTLLC